VTLQTWLAFFLTETALCFVPGPAVLYVVGQAMRHGAPRALAANAGILSGNAVYFVLSGLGLAALVAAAAPLFVAVKWAGVAYLAWLGLRELHAALRGGATLTAAKAAPTGWRMWRQGLLLQLANPKAILFFTALLPQFVDAREPIAAQIAILGITTAVTEFIVLNIYGVLAARGGTALATRPRLARVTQAAAGTCLLGAGAGLALAHVPE
jgi:homoserine/homoserine lactone efflux protein